MRNLVEEITELLTKHGHPSPKKWEEKLHPDAFSHPEINVRRFLINRYWHHEIGRYLEDTIPVRQYLIEQGSTADWLRLFENGVIPCVIRNAKIYEQMNK